MDPHPKLELPASRGCLETERMVLEPPTQAHARLLLDSLRDPSLYRFMKGVQPPSLRELELLFQEGQAGDSQGGRQTWLQWAAWAREERRHVGLFEATVDEDGRAGLAFMTFSSFLRRGFALEACRRILRHLFTEHAASVVFVDTAVENAPARALAERIGFHERRVEPFFAYFTSIGDTPADGQVRYLIERQAFVSKMDLV